jgi:iron complex transport system ATP-binding protein
MSEGEKKRVLIARSLMADPDLLLLDEPGSGLDLGARERLVDSLVSLAGNRDAPPIVLVTHHVEEIPPGFEHVLVLASGPVDEVLTADTLSRTFDMPLEIERRGGRWRAWADPEWFDERVT